MSPEISLYPDLNTLGNFLRFCDTETVCDNPRPPDVFHTLRSYLICSGHNVLELGPQVKVTVTLKQDVTLRYSKMYPHIIFGIPTTSNNVCLGM